MIWFLPLHAIGVFFIIFFTFVNITATIVDIFLEVIDAIAGVFAQTFEPQTNGIGPEKLIWDDPRKLSPDSVSKQQQEILPQSLGPNGVVQDDDDTPAVRRPLRPMQQLFLDNPDWIRRTFEDHERREEFRRNIANTDSDATQPMDIPGARLGRRNAISGPTLFANENDVPVGGPPRSPGIMERTATPVTAGLLRAQRHGVAPPTFRRRRINGFRRPLPDNVARFNVIRGRFEVHEATRRVSQSATIEQGDAASDEPEEDAYETSSRMGASPENLGFDNDDTTNEQLLSAVLSGPRHQDPEVHMVLHVPDPRTQTLPEEERAALEGAETRERRVAPASQATNDRVSLEARIEHQVEDEQRPPTIRPITPQRSQHENDENTMNDPMEESTPTPSIPSLSAAADSESQSQTPEATRDRRHMRALITNATQRGLRAATESHNSPSPVRPFMRSMSPSPPSPTPRPRRRSWPSRAGDMSDTSMARAVARADTGPDTRQGIVQDGYVDDDDENADRYLELGD